MVSIKKALIMGGLSLVLTQSQTECVFSGFWNKLSNITGYKFTKEQTERAENKNIYTHSDAQQP